MSDKDLPTDKEGNPILNESEEQREERDVKGLPKPLAAAFKRMKEDPNYDPFKVSPRFFRLGDDDRWLLVISESESYRDPKAMYSPELLRFSITINNNHIITFNSIYAYKFVVSMSLPTNTITIATRPMGIFGLFCLWRPQHPFHLTLSFDEPGAYLLPVRSKDGKYWFEPLTRLSLEGENELRAALKLARQV